jgi:CheY-like chemotaxis protein
MASNMNRDDLPHVLCVDDEPRVVDGLALHLRREYQVLTANGAQSALQAADAGRTRIGGRRASSRAKAARPHSRLEPVMEILDASQRVKSDLPEGLIKLGAGILRLVLEYDAQIAQGRPIHEAIAATRAQALRHDGKLVERLESLVGASVSAQQLSEVAVGDVIPGMVFVDELRTHIGTLLVPKGFEVTETFLERMRNFGPGILQERVRVMAAPKRAP